MSLVSEIVLAILGALSGMSWVLYVKETKRAKSLENAHSEIENVKLAVELQQGQLLSMQREIDRLQATLVEKANIIKTLYTEKDFLEFSNSQKKNAINTALECKLYPDCPVIQRIQQLELLKI